MDDSIGRLLIADQDESFLSAITDLLQKEGYICTPVRDGLEALQALRGQEFDLMITEIQMTGNQELELVRAVPIYTEGIPVIIYTAYPSLGTAIASNQLGVFAYFIKPVEFSVLLHHVKMNIANFHNHIRSMGAREELQNCQDKLGQIDLLTSAITETIQVLETTKSSFKSKKLAALRRKLERLIAEE
ncbi:MAG TPA: response regulator [Anaerolineaceae bacterium]|nr:response regulator [Anaerolineaceae bacterium]